MPTINRPHLTLREHDVMRLILCGHNDGQIAAQLYLGLQTVTTYVQHACHKLGAANRTVAALKYDLYYGTPLTACTSCAPPLSPREQMVIEMVASGASDRVIAAHLHLSLSTVRQHMLSLRQKLGAPNRIAAAVEYYRQVRLLSYMKMTGSTSRH
ncbi:helix-turn-helix transcriptional regulator [Candidatus Chloroploca sp. M-50]|uniref:Helix-turn-helix transcriptional regulator n=1 Tax=Candidatus Chloroploca mongolica TaxID=2528176 RepID=A0ABS4DCS1_9CHLR|nr:helix-turn-helix transcriptional regulator [Candidatus Chloroploca mongolica]MBP1467237.1 helix-turn-helix transcriptional regulator [Candidatus Chloroploca mongolica]